MDETEKMATKPVGNKKPGNGDSAGQPGERQESPVDAGNREATPEEIIHALFERAGGRGKVDDQRAAGRFSWVTKLSVRIIDPIGAPRDIEVTTRDLSTGGFSFVHNQFVHEGTIVITRIKGLPHQPTIMCVVRHCEHISGAKHRVGVRFERNSQH